MREVFKIAIGDWIVSRSDSFRSMMMRFRDHQINTKTSFNRVKQKHRDYEAKLRELDARVREVEAILEEHSRIPVRERRRKR